MRIFLAASVAILATAPAGAATRNFGVSGFDRVRLDGPFRVNLTTGVAPFARASGSQSAIDRVAMEVVGSTLVIHTSRSSWGGYPGEPVGPVEINIGTHDFTAAWVNGAGSLEVDRVKGLGFELSVQGSGAASIANADVDQLKVAIAGTASAVLGGKAGRMTAVVRGISTLDASALQIKDATIGADGAATVRADITGTAKVDGSGPATVTLTGKPACTLRIKGSASVSGCKTAQ